MIWIALGIAVMVFLLAALMAWTDVGEEWNAGVHGKRHPEDLPAIRYGVKK
jgi:hypothetical protein